MAENIVGSLSNLESMLNLFATELIESSQLHADMEEMTDSMDKVNINHIENNNDVTELDKEEPNVSYTKCDHSQNREVTNGEDVVKKGKVQIASSGLFYRNRPNMLNSLNAAAKDSAESALMSESPHTVSEDSLDGECSVSEMYEADISSEETDINSFSESISDRDKFHSFGRKYNEKACKCETDIQSHLLLDHPYSARAYDDSSNVDTECSYFTCSDVEKPTVNDSLDDISCKSSQVCSDSEGYNIHDLQTGPEQFENVYIENVQYSVPSTTDICPLIHNDYSRDDHLSSDSLEHSCEQNSALQTLDTQTKARRKSSVSDINSSIIVSEFFPDVSFQSIYPADVSSEGNSSDHMVLNKADHHKTELSSETKVIDEEEMARKDCENDKSSNENVDESADCSLVFAKCKRPIICSEFPVGAAEDWYYEDSIDGSDNGDSINESEDENIENSEVTEETSKVESKQSRLHDILTAELGQGQLSHWDDDARNLDEQLETELKLHRILEAELGKLEIKGDVPVKSDIIQNEPDPNQKTVQLEGVTVDSTETELSKHRSKTENEALNNEEVNAGYLKVDKSILKTDMLDTPLCSPAGSSFELLRNEANTDESSMSEAISFTNSQIIDLSLSPGPIPSKYYSSPIDGSDHLHSSVETNISLISSLPPNDKKNAKTGDSDEEFENDSLEDPDDFTFSSLNIGDDGNCDTQNRERRVKSEPTYFKYSDIHVENRAEDKAKKLLAKEKFVFGALADCELDLSNEPVPQIIHSNPLKPMRSIMKSSQSSIDEMFRVKGIRTSSVDSEKKSVSFDEKVAQIGLIMCDYDSLDDDIWHDYDESSTVF